MNKVYDVLIIGGGIIGHSISFFLNKCGVHTVVVDKQASGNKATQAAAGMLGVHTENEKTGAYHKFCEKSRDLYGGLHKELREITSIDIELSKFGMAEVAVHPDEKKRLHSKKMSFPYLTWEEGQSLRERIPALSENALGALFMQEDGHVEPRQVCEALKRAALYYGGDVLEDQAVIGFKKKGDSFTVNMEHSTVSAEHVVVASGADSGRWFKDTGLCNPIVPTKGECFSIKMREKFFNEALFFRDFYVVPKADGRCIVGATSKAGDQSTDTSAGGLSDLMNRVFSHFPEWREAAFLNFWSGVRPGTEDGVPVIGEHPSISKLYFATGHYRNGILLAPATGQLLKNMITKKKIDPSIQALFSANRLVERGESTYEYSS
ncbi:glycine oxidase ThiO [Halobacillus sp. A5]|uniref:glycine oxidase ThiO n=1 Tax=Halobacillus sp. A5 TaxID=2880263 RepID=UPI0020A6C940|nr:glycine oxidase ThiO [Halobacillus sp. A5]MCP3028563.1 glycine oxidase ThiO [Halobacillus sp. A5]